MTSSKTAVANKKAKTLDVQNFTLPWKVAAAFFGTLFLTLSSFIEVPMVPVPITLQTFAVMLVGALYGWRLGGVTIVAWLVAAALGLPVLSGGDSGVQYFLGATGGYLFAFPVAGMAVGWLTARGWDGQRVWLSFLAMLIGNAICLTLGAAWLAVLIGAKQAILAGVVPFLIGGVLKSGLGAMTLKLLTRDTQHTAE
ncbi:biotin transporter BioY (plasmid) [Pseudorhodobacter turbinis]|uniref:Biotin transporter n=1 Tax=Pseudorhodobacter turbinis TaxID=2500533 RepID=A0A4P8ELJ7_9RHOB|nr:biotin transporter BioY [Pseudorhodobacter turbinis]QCO57685.1 biotin transporter BioY [Pseudorhodobacter turbinis]